MQRERPMDAIETAAQAEEISALDLREEAIGALRRGERVQYHVADQYNGEAPETLVVGTRAGQAWGGTAVWGDWDAATETIRLDDGECEHDGCGCRPSIALDGSGVCASTPKGN